MTQKALFISSFSHSVRIKRIAYVLACVLITGLFLKGAAWLLADKECYILMDGFYDRANEYDVLLFGNSHMDMGILPMELYRDYGITSYNLALSNEPIEATYYQIKDALKHTKPKLVVIDTWGIQHDAALQKQSHWFLDAIPLSSYKMQVVDDLIGDEDKEEWLFPFSLYHNRWDSINKDSFSYKPSVEKGANLDHSRYSEEGAFISKVERSYRIAATDINEEDRLGKEYLAKSIELCQSEGVEVLMISVPCQPTEEEQKHLNYAYTISKEFGVPYYNMWIDDGYLDLEVDYFDSGHLDSSGARKATRKFGDYLIQNYSGWIYDGETRESWNDDYDNYLKFKADWMEKQETLFQFSMLLNDEDFYYESSEEDGISTYRVYESASEELVIEKSFNGQGEAI